jgi:hypothetical protein
MQTTHVSVASIEVNPIAARICAITSIKYKKKYY